MGTVAEKECIDCHEVKAACEFYRKREITCGLSVCKKPLSLCWHGARSVRVRWSPIDARKPSYAGHKCCEPRGIRHAK